MKPASSYTKDGLKICSDCKIPQSKECYYSNRKKWNGIVNICKVCCRNRSKAVDKEKERIRRRIKYLKYKDKEIQRGNIYKANRCKNDPGFKMLKNLRDRHLKAVKAAKNNKTFRTTDLLGCTADELKKYIEDQFTLEMNWENHGSVWHIDHIYPLALVNWDNPEEVNKVCNYKNLRPLLALDNIRKGKSIS
jgi:hypothetical protein